MASTAPAIPPACESVLPYRNQDQGGLAGVDRYGSWIAIGSLAVPAAPNSDAARLPRAPCGQTRL